MELAVVNQMHNHRSKGVHPPSTTCNSGIDKLLRVFLAPSCDHRCSCHWPPLRQPAGVEQHGGCTTGRDTNPDSEQAEQLLVGPTERRVKGGRVVEVPGAEPIEGCALLLGRPQRQGRGIGQRSTRPPELEEDDYRVVELWVGRHHSSKSCHTAMPIPAEGLRRSSQGTG
ncbi:MAG: hypothetical protein FWF02_00940 [Micrococcales bacterium]|nr:hypothetical protein [Micrococcales bacterium]MCL2666262.1 hypothetical protein [Micrococcales bacterium]